MKNLIPGIRNAARAVIVRDEQILLLRKQGGGQGERFALPGGAQDLGETLAQALNRECEEEIGTAVEIVRLLHIADYFKHRDTDPPSRRHLLEILFECTVPAGYLPRNGYRPDKHQVEVVWMPVDTLSAIKLLPASLSSYLGDNSGSADAIYLGEIG
jgi:ADP-ribose pyrophosphatase YjhB (NUDIX family)